MTDQLKELANECKERGIDFDDVSPNQGSTSCDKLVRHYIAAASPDVVLALIAEVERLKSQEPVAYVVSIGNSPISITCPVKHLDLLAKSHNAPLYLASGAAPTRPTTPEQQAEPPPEWLLIKNILDEYGLDAIVFAAAWKAVQQRAEPVAYFDFQELKFTWAKHMKISPVPVSVKVEPMKLYSESTKRQWVGLTNEDWEHIDNKKGTSLDTFVQGATWAEVQLRERNT